MTKEAKATIGLNMVKKPVTTEKGMAAPSPTLDEKSVTSEPTKTMETPTAPPPPKNDTTSEAVEFLAMKNISVKVDIVTYKKLKKHGGDMGGKTNQAIFTEALALYFTKNGVK